MLELNPRPLLKQDIAIKYAQWFSSLLHGAGWLENWVMCGHPGNFHFETETVMQPPGPASVNLRVHGSFGRKVAIMAWSHAAVFQPCNHSQRRSHALRDSGAVPCCTSLDVLNVARVQALNRGCWLFFYFFLENKQKV